MKPGTWKAYLKTKERTPKEVRSWRKQASLGKVPKGLERRLHLVRTRPMSGDLEEILQRWMVRVPVVTGPAASPPISVRNVHKVENNIHAGAKYIRFIIDRYYADEAMLDLDRMLFAFASYNAGPNRIDRLRKKATRQGLDPNVWIGSVEIVAGREIGQETVRYVSNIFKYYLVYKMVVEDEARKNTTPLEGGMRYMADAARFTECRSGRSYPIAMEADYVRMERAYLEAAGEPGGPLYVTFEGFIAPRPKMEGDGLEPTVVVERFLNVWPGKKCERDAAK